MFKTDSEKLNANPLRRALAERGHSIRSAARELNITPVELVYRIAAHDPDCDFASRVKSLPPRQPAKMRARVSTKTKKATAA